jgi:DNA-binding MarR family transcriptional regulator
VYRVQDADDRRKVVMFSSDRGKALTQRLNSLALRQEAHIAENCGNKATADLKRLLESLIEKAN